MFDKVLLDSRNTLIGTSPGGGKVGRTISVRVPGRAAIHAQCVTDINPGRCVVMLSDRGWLAAGSVARLVGQRTVENRVKKGSTPRIFTCTVKILSARFGANDAIELWMSGDRDTPELIAELPRASAPYTDYPTSFSGSSVLTAIRINMVSTGLGPDDWVATVVDVGSQPATNPRLTRMRLWLITSTGAILYTYDWQIESDPEAGDGVGFESLGCGLIGTSWISTITQPVSPVEVSKDRNLVTVTRESGLQTVASDNYSGISDQEGEPNWKSQTFYHTLVNRRCEYNIYFGTVLATTHILIDCNGNEIVETQGVFGFPQPRRLVYNGSRVLENEPVDAFIDQAEDSNLSGNKVFRYSNGFTNILRVGSTALSVSQENIPTPVLSIPTLATHGFIFAQKAFCV